MLTMLFICFVFVLLGYTLFMWCEQQLNYNGPHCAFSVSEIAVVGQPGLIEYGFFSIGAMSQLSMSWVRGENTLCPVLPVCFVANSVRFVNWTDVATCVKVRIHQCVPAAAGRESKTSSFPNLLWQTIYVLYQCLFNHNARRLTKYTVPPPPIYGGRWWGLVWWMGWMMDHTQYTFLHQKLWAKFTQKSIKTDEYKYNNYIYTNMLVKTHQCVWLVNCMVV